MKKLFILSLGVLLSFGFVAMKEQPQEQVLHLKVGDSFGGGIVFFTKDNGAHGMIAALEDQDEGLRWFGGAKINTEDGVGAGRRNTSKIARKGKTPDLLLASKLCKEYFVEEGIYRHGNWYLPSKLELSILFSKKDVVGGFANKHYWSSTILGDDLTWFQNFENGRQNVNVSKSNGVRAVSYF